MAESETDLPAVSRLGPRSGQAMVYLAVLLIGIVTLVAWARLTDRPLLAQPLALPLTSERVMHITADLDGAAHITDERAKLIAKYAPGEAVFISTIVRVVRRERQKIDANLDAPIHLRRRGETRLTIFDPETQRETELSSFGKDNVASFAALLDMPAR